MDVLGLPERIVTRPESPPVLVEFVTEHEVPSLPGPPARIRVRLGRGIDIDQVGVAQSRGDLTGPVDSTEVVSSERVRLVPSKVDDQRVSSKQGHERQDEDGDAPDVFQSTECEDGPAPIRPAVPLGIRVVQVIIWFRVVQGDIGTPRRRIGGQGKLVADARCQGVP